MKTFLPYYFEYLKKEVLSKSKLERITPSDCKYLSDLINQDTRRYISETTLKRLFGFAHSKFNPSLFTLNALSDFCGYNGWDGFCKDYQTNDDEVTHNQWDLLALRANRITQHTINLVKSKSGIPYAKTISRKFMDEHMQFFLDSNCSATVLSAPADFGKTIALNHWIEQQVATNKAGYKNDIFLYFGNNLIQHTLLSGNGIMDWLLALLGVYGDKQLEALDIQREEGHKLYLVIDGIDESLIRHNQFNLFCQLVDIVSLYEKYSWLKLILTMRSSVWISNRHYITNKRAWFTGFMEGTNDDINVPLLDHQEILELTGKLGAEDVILKSKYMEDFAYPLYVEYYWKNNPGQFSLGLLNGVSQYDAVSSYFLERIYHNRYSEDILHLLKGLCDMIKVKDNHYKIDRFHAHPLIRQYEKAYRELLSLGFLEEYNESSGTDYLGYIQVNHQHVLARLLAKKLMMANGDRFDKNLVDRFIEQYQPCDLKLAILKWCIYITVSSDRPCSFDLLQCIELNISERSKLIVFLAELLKKNHAGRGMLEEQGDNDWKENLNYFFGLQFIHKGYEQALNTLMSFKLFEGHQVIVRCCLAVIAIFQLDIRKLEEHIAHLKKEHDAYFLDFPINPLTCLETVYFYLKFGIVKTEALEMLTRFYFNPPKQRKTYPDNFDEILYLLGLYTLTICRNGKKTLRFLKVLENIHPAGSTGYDFLCKMIKAETYLALDRKKEAVELFSEVAATYPERERTYTSFMKISYHALKLKLDNLQGTPQYGQINSLIRLCDDLSYKLTKVQSLAFLLHQNNSFKEDPKLFNKLQIDLLKTARSSGCSADSFK